MNLNSYNEFKNYEFDYEYEKNYEFGLKYVNKLFSHIKQLTCIN